MRWNHITSARGKHIGGRRQAQGTKALTYHVQLHAARVAATLMDQRGVHKEGIIRILLAVFLFAVTAARALLVPSAQQPLLEQRHHLKLKQPTPTSLRRSTTRIRSVSCSTPCCSGSSPPEGLAQQHQRQQQGGAAGASGGISAATLLPVDDYAVTRTEALTRFFVASLAAFSTSAVVAGAVAGAAAPETQRAPPPPAADGLGVVDDLLADCPSVSVKERRIKRSRIFVLCVALTAVMPPNLVLTARPRVDHIFRTSISV